MRDKYVAYWVKLASRFATNEFVVGYELMNEPFGMLLYVLRRVM